MASEARPSRSRHGFGALHPPDQAPPALPRPFFPSSPPFLSAPLAFSAPPRCAFFPPSLPAPIPPIGVHRCSSVVAPLSFPVLTALSPAFSPSPGPKSAHFQGFSAIPYFCIASLRSTIDHCTPICPVTPHSIPLCRTTFYCVTHSFIALCFTLMRTTMSHRVTQSPVVLFFDSLRRASSRCGAWYTGCRTVRREG